VFITIEPGTFRITLSFENWGVSLYFLGSIIYTQSMIYIQFIQYQNDKNIPVLAFFCPVQMKALLV